MVAIKIIKPITLLIVIPPFIAAIKTVNIINVGLDYSI
jgi:hypothetical protein